MMGPIDQPVCPSLRGFLLQDQVCSTKPDSSLYYRH